MNPLAHAHVNAANRLSVLHLRHPCRLSFTPTVANKLVRGGTNASLEHSHLNGNHRLLQLDPTPLTVEVGLESCPKTRRGNREGGDYVPQLINKLMRSPFLSKIVSRQKVPLQVFFFFFCLPAP